MDVAGRKILITGGARGIGRRLAVKLAARNARLVLVGRDGDRLRCLQAELGEETEIVACDLSQYEATDRLAERVTADHPDLSVLVNNAAAQAEMDFVEGCGAGHIAEARAELSLNLAAPIALAAALMPVMKRQPDAAIINVTTALALAPKKAAPVYCASKAGLRSFTQALRYQCRDDAAHVRVREVIMSLVNTDMTRGRGRGKISADAAADAIVSAIEGDRDEVWVGKIRLLPLLVRLSPKTVQRMLR
ncbi:MAG: SDR family NAD(P)-dependent oxidoreductase [Rhizobiaceae bacterium]